MKPTEDRQFCVSVRTKRSQSAQIQQIQNEGKQYRTLLSIFTENLNLMVRTHKNCLGDVDLLPKVKTSREEYLLIMQQLQRIYGRMEEKMIRDVLNRNTLTKKSIEDFAELHKSTFQEEVRIKKYNSQTQEVDTPQLTKEYSSEQRQSAVNSTPKRPQSSKQTRNVKMSLINQAYQAMQANHLLQTYKIKTVIAHTSQNPQNKKQACSIGTSHLKPNRFSSRGKKILFNNKNRYENIPTDQQKKYQQFLFNGEQIIINERKSIENPSQYDYQSQNSPYSRRQSTKRMINLKFAQRKSIQQVQKMQIQNRIMMINSVLSVNLVQPQGYRPKTRCWQNYFN